jgi:hypothetical protein
MMKNFSSSYYFKLIYKIMRKTYQVNLINVTKFHNQLVSHIIYQQNQKKEAKFDPKTSINQV